jgi:hypothetical protein
MGTMHRTLNGAASVLFCLAIVACESPTQRRATEHAAEKKEVAAEVERICALPEPQRQEALKKVKAESGMELYCAEKK